MKKIIVIGAGAAGAKAASKAKRMDKENHVELYSMGEDVAVSLCGLPYFIEGSIDDVNKLIIKTPSDFVKMGISVFMNSALEEIFPEEKCVLINGNHIFYDELILALGARVNIPKIKNIASKNVFTLRNLRSAKAIKEKMQSSKKALIVGGGYIALELLEAFVKNGLDVVIVERSNDLINDFDDDFSEIIHKIVLEKYNDKIEIITNDEIIEFQKEDETFKSAITKKGLTIEADFCVISTGVKPNIEIPAKAGIKLGTTGAIAVDNKMRTNMKNIFACGDCAEKYSIITREPVYIGLGTIATKEGRVSAINATSLENYEIFDGILGSTVTRFFDFSIAKTGISYKKALMLKKIIDIDPIQVNITKKDKASYMPDAREIYFKLIADRRSGELLGAQAVGHVGNTIQRINTISSALKLRYKVSDILYLDLPYAPPFSGSTDPILTASYKLKEMLNN